MRIIKYIALASATLLALGASGTAFAGIATGTLPVTALVLESCTVVAAPMVFGSLNVGGTANDTSALITLACTPNADYDIALDFGQNATGGVRRMKSVLGAEFLPYEIYQNSTRTTPWGTAAADQLHGTAPLGVGLYTAYGRIPASAASVTAGAYADTVTVTVNF